MTYAPFLRRGGKLLLCNAGLWVYWYSTTDDATVRHRLLTLLREAEIPDESWPPLCEVSRDNQLGQPVLDILHLKPAPPNLNGLIVTGDAYAETETPSSGPPKTRKKH